MVRVDGCVGVVVVCGVVVGVNGSARLDSCIVVGVRWFGVVVVGVSGVVGGLAVLSGVYEIVGVVGVEIVDAVVVVVYSK